MKLTLSPLLRPGTQPPSSGNADSIYAWPPGRCRAARLLLHSAERCDKLVMWGEVPLGHGFLADSTGCLYLHMRGTKTRTIEYCILSQSRRYTHIHRYPDFQEGATQSNATFKALFIL